MAKKEELGRRKARRRMAWVALVSMIAVTYAVLFKVDVVRLKILEQVITWYYFSMASIVGAYVGFATVFDMKNLKGQGTPKEEEDEEEETPEKK